jgi:hypothetical protein
LGYQQAQGAQIKYLARYRDRPVACLSFGPAAFRVAARDRFIGWSAQQRQERLPWVVNNDRFLLLPWVVVPHLASFVVPKQRNRPDRITEDLRVATFPHVPGYQRFPPTETAGIINLTRGICVATVPVVAAPSRLTFERL